MSVHVVGWFSATPATYYLHFSQLLFENSTEKVTSTRTLLSPAHVKQVRVLTQKELPEGTSGV